MGSERLGAFRRWPFVTLVTLLANAVLDRL